MGNGVARQHGADPIFSGASLEALTRLADTGRYLSPPRRSASPVQHIRRAPTHPDALAGRSSDEAPHLRSSAHKNDSELCYRFPEKHAPRSRPNSPPPPPPLPLPLPLQMPATPRAARRHIKGEEDTRDWNELGPEQRARHDDAASSSSQSSLEGSPFPWAQGQMEIAPRSLEQPWMKDKNSSSSGPAGATPLWSPQSSRPASPVREISSRPASPSPRPLQVRYLTSSAQPEEPPHSSRPASPSESPRSPPPELHLTKQQGPQWKSKPLQTPPFHSTPKIGLSPPQMLMTPSLPQLPPLQPPLLVPPCGAGMDMFGASRSVTTTPGSPQGVRMTSPHPGWQSARSSAASLAHALVTEHDSRDSGMMSERWQSPRRLPPPSELLQGSWVAGAWPHQNAQLATSNHNGIHGNEQSDATVQRAHFQARMLPPAAHVDPSTALSWLPTGVGEMASLTPSTPSALASIVPSPHGRVRIHAPRPASKNTLELAALSHRVNSVLRKCKSQLERPQGGTPVSERGDVDKLMNQVVVQDAEASGDISFGAALNSSLRSTCTFGVREPSPEGFGPYPGDSPRREVKRTLPDQTDVCCTSTSASSSSSGSPLSETSARQSHVQSRQSLSAFPTHRPEPPQSFPIAFTPRRQDGARRSSEPVSNDISQWPWKQQQVQTHDGPSPGAESADHGLGARVRQRSSPGGESSHHVAQAERARAASVTSRAVSPFHARIASNCDALETEMMRAREERSRRASKVQRIIADSKLASQQSGQTRITQFKREEAPRRTIATHQLPAPPMETPWAAFQGHLG
mmetsp:Transcript_139455/g.253666  ORF Transcript_139455/g.253666 Transcript_139455/m.253666 type:complete len:801 (+) Transcript_139455:62-2464(+)